MMSRVASLVLFLLISSVLYAQQIKKGDAIVYFSLKDGYYQTEVYKRKVAHPQTIRICREEELNFVNYGSALYNNGTGEKLYNLIIKPIEKDIKKGDHIYFVPAGQLHFINLSALKDDAGNYLGDSYHFHRLSSKNEYMAISEYRRKSNNVQSYYTNWILFGGMDYLANPDLMYSRVRMLHVHEMENLFKDIVPNNSTENLTFGTAEDGTRAGYDNLKYSKDEIKDLWSIRGDYGIQFFTGYRACEEEFRFEVRRNEPYIVLISTHGFTYGANEYDEMACGLLFSGAGHTLEGRKLPYRLNDGILYAQEIETLDMHAASMVVLAACNTGLGVVTQDGVKGLQSAFKKAGAKTLVLTLWSVNDRATSAFVKSMFTHLKKGKNKHDAFELAIKDLRASSQFHDPVYWAPFVMLD